jgi:hypothetical protein
MRSPPVLFMVGPGKSGIAAFFQNKGQSGSKTKTVYHFMLTISTEFPTGTFPIPVRNMLVFPHFSVFRSAHRAFRILQASIVTICIF